jgi:hypothetical protein
MKLTCRDYLNAPSHYASVVTEALPPLLLAAAEAGRPAVISLSEINAIADAIADYAREHPRHGLRWAIVAALAACTLPSGTPFAT